MLCPPGLWWSLWIRVSVILGPVSIPTLIGPPGTESCACGASPAAPPRTTAMCDFKQLCYILLCLFLPPIAVLISRGCSVMLLLNFLLTLLGLLPGAVHALMVYFKDEHAAKRQASVRSHSKQVSLA